MLLVRLVHEAVSAWLSAVGFCAVFDTARDASGANASGDQEEREDSKRDDIGWSWRPLCHVFVFCIILFVSCTRQQDSAVYPTNP